MRQTWVKVLIGIIGGLFLLAVVFKGGSMLMTWWFFTSPDGIRVVPAAHPVASPTVSTATYPGEPEYKDMSVQEAQRQADFVIYLPGDMAAQAQQSVSFMPAWTPPAGPPQASSVSVHYPDSEDSVIIFEYRHDRDFWLGDEGEAIRLNGTTAYWVKSLAELELTLGDTDISLSAAEERKRLGVTVYRSASKEDLVRIAKTLKPGAPEIARQKGLLKE